MQETFELLTTYGYILLFVYSLGGGFVGLTAAGVLSHVGKLDLGVSIGVAMTANFLGDMLLFWLARYQKEEIWPYLKKHRRKFALSHLLMRRHGAKIIFFQKFIYGVKTMIPLAIGLTKYSLYKFGIYNALSSVFWALTVGFASYFAGAYIIRAYEAVLERPYLFPLIVGTILGLIYWYFSTFSKKR